MRIFAVISLFLLTACGFKPLYQSGEAGAAVEAALTSIEVAPIADRVGQQMRNRLLDRLTPSGNGDYRLYVTLDQSVETYGTRPDTATTQEQITLIAHVQLVSLADGTIMLEEQMRARSSFDIVLSDYATVIQREDTARRLALELAERIHRRLVLQFRES